MPNPTKWPMTHYIKIIPVITMTIMIPMINPNMHPMPFATPLKKLMIIIFFWLMNTPISVIARMM